MKSRDFCYWLQGYFELHHGEPGITASQAKLIQNHLNMVFQHEIDPSFGGPAEQAKLSATHSEISDEQLAKLRKAIEDNVLHPPSILDRPLMC